MYNFLMIILIGLSIAIWIDASWSIFKSMRLIKLLQARLRERAWPSYQERIDNGDHEA